jgi:hypothetical protein
MATRRRWEGLLIERTPAQERAFREATDKLKRELLPMQVMAFAAAAEQLLLTGKAYEMLVEMGKEPLAIANELGCCTRGLRQAGELAETYGDLDSEELVNAACLAVQRGELTIATLNRCLESRQALLKALDVGGGFARALVDWQRMTATGEPPPVGFVACNLAVFMGECLAKDACLEMSCGLAAAFPDGQLSVKQAESLVGDYWLREVTPELIDEIAARAVEMVSESNAVVAAPDKGQHAVCRSVDSAAWE